MNKQKRMRELEKEQETLLDETDPASFFGMISIICDESDQEMEDFVESRLYRKLLQFSQSNPEKTHAAIVRAIEIDEEIAELDD